MGDGETDQLHARGRAEERADWAIARTTIGSPSTVLALIERVTLDPSADVQKLERLTAMYYRLKAKEAEFAYHAAKGRILKKLAGIPEPAD